MWQLQDWLMRQFTLSMKNIKNPSSSDFPPGRPQPVGWIS